MSTILEAARASLAHWTAIRCPVCGVWVQSQDMELRTVLLPELDLVLAVVDCPECHETFDPVTYKVHPEARADGFPRLIRELRGLSAK